MIKFKDSKQLCFDDILMVPQHSDIESRKDVSLSMIIGNDIILGFPVIASPMDTVCEKDMAIAIGTGLGNILSGDAGFGDFFKGLFAVVGQGMITLGKYFIKMAIKVEAFKDLIKLHPVLAIAAGIALIAIGTAISNSMKKPAFAVGTRNAPGGMALVGERGPEMINLPRGSSVTPAAQTASMMGGMQSVEVYGMLRGQDIFFSNKKKSYSILYVSYSFIYFIR